MSDYILYHPSIKDFKTNRDISNELVKIKVMYKLKFDSETFILDRLKNLYYNCEVYDKIDYFIKEGNKIECIEIQEFISEVIFKNNIKIFS